MFFVKHSCFLFFVFLFCLAFNLLCFKVFLIVERFFFSAKYKYNLCLWLVVSDISISSVCVSQCLFWILYYNMHIRCVCWFSQCNSCYFFRFVIFIGNDLIYNYITRHKLSLFDFYIFQNSFDFCLNKKQNAGSVWDILYDRHIQQRTI